MLGYGPKQWARLAWWARQAYINGILWEMELGGWRVQRVIPVDGGGGGGDAGGSFVPLDSLESRAAEGITTSVVYQDPQ